MNFPRFFNDRFLSLDYNTKASKSERNMKCIYCGRRAVANYSDKLLCKKHYLQYLEQAHEWQEKRWQGKIKSTLKNVALKNQIKKRDYPFYYRDKK